MTATERSLHLSQGRARFEVASDARPFRVRAGAGEVTASQGVLDVAYGDDQNITVRVISGEAKVGPIAPGRSEEHTSELQSLMRISYAVFCLKKKTINK